MEINFDDYISEEEKKEIIKNVFERHCAELFKNDAERIFSNAAYKTVYKIIDDQHNGEVDKIIADKAIKCIDELSCYSVFRAEDYWNKQSKAHNSLNDAIAQNKQRLVDKISNIIDEMDKNELKESLKEFSMDLLDEKLFGAKNDR